MGGCPKPTFAHSDPPTHNYIARHSPISSPKHFRLAVRPSSLSAASNPTPQPPIPPDTATHSPLSHPSRLREAVRGRRGRQAGRCPMEWSWRGCRHGDKPAGGSAGFCGNCTTCSMGGKSTCDNRTLFVRGNEDIVGLEVAVIEVFRVQEGDPVGDLLEHSINNFSRQGNFGIRAARDSSSEEINVTKDSKLCDKDKNLTACTVDREGERETPVCKEIVSFRREVYRKNLTRYED